MVVEHGAVQSFMFHGLSKNSKLPIAPRRPVISRVRLPAVETPSMLVRSFAYWTKVPPAVEKTASTLNEVTERAPLADTVIPSVPAVVLSPSKTLDPYWIEFHVTEVPLSVIGCEAVFGGAPKVKVEFHAPSVPISLYVEPLYTNVGVC